MILLGIDPGITTGYALLEAKGARDFVSLDAGAVRGQEGIDYLLTITPKPDVYVIETFTLWPKLAVKVAQDDPSLLTSQCIGALTFNLWKRRAQVVFHQPANKKSCPDSLIRQVGLWRPSSDQTPHERDAIRHAIIHARMIFAGVERDRRRQKKLESLRKPDVIDWQV